eukprot:TRINITY_DN80488_c0_g1_i1.p1 TRINITY_DN80488_c0_g1~~TRINITY_DN80488_c0_g1_i1.p1  ORF type:complete len:530 (+),score=135.06 TRINITY_DN80488_c0_g1_i1:147-1736(+)
MGGRGRGKGTSKVEEDRDWSTLRASPSSWQPVAKAQEDHGAGGSSPSRTPAGGSDAAEGHGRGYTASGFRTDTEISSKKWGAKSNNDGRELKRWQAVDQSDKFDGGIEDNKKSFVPMRNCAQAVGHCKPVQADVEEGSLEELAGGKKGLKSWDQFKMNAELFGIVSTFKPDLSQYTVPLPTKLSPEMRKRAGKIAEEIERESGGGGNGDRDLRVYDGVGDDGHYDQYQEEGEYDGRYGGGYGWQADDVDEEELWSSVARQGGGGGGGGGKEWKPVSSSSRGGKWQPVQNTDDSGDGAGQGNAAGAIMALLGGSGGCTGGASSSVAGSNDFRGNLGTKVRSWWQARQCNGHAIPAGAGDALVCPFSHRVFGDVTQLLTHWAAALPKGDDPSADSSTPSRAATEEFRRSVAETRWDELLERYSLTDVLPVTSPKQGSVWEKIVEGVSKARRNSDVPLSQRPAQDFVAEAMRMRCWQRDQKVQHREVLETMAGAVALRILDHVPAQAPVPWSVSGGDASSAPSLPAMQGPLQ